MVGLFETGRYYLNHHLLEKTDFDKKNIYLLDGNVKEEKLESFCNAYEKRIENLGGIDIQILGIGTNGHIAFNEPGTPRNSKTRIVDLTENTIKDNSRFFDSIDEVPTQAMTMGIDTIMKAKTIYLIAQGEHKRDILEKAVYGEITPEVPAAFLQEHQKFTIFRRDLI